MCIGIIMSALREEKEERKKNRDKEKDQNQSFYLFMDFLKF